MDRVGGWKHSKPRSTAGLAVSYTVRGDTLGNQTERKVTIFQAWKLLHNFSQLLNTQQTKIILV